MAEITAGKMVLPDTSRPQYKTGKAAAFTNAALPVFLFCPARMPVFSLPDDGHIAFNVYIFSGITNTFKYIHIHIGAWRTAFV
jgi:hypothetical protein